MDKKYELEYKKIHDNIISLIGKNKDYSLNDLEKVIKQVFDAKKIELDEINTIMKKGYKLYHDKCNTPEQISEDMILNDDYVGTYLINTGIDNVPTKKDSVYVDTAVMISSKDGKKANNYVIFNGTKEICTYLEILCNNTLDDIDSRY